MADSHTSFLFNGQEAYDEAYKIGIKTYNKSITNGGLGYLPSLDKIVTSSKAISEYDLGTIEIPLKKICGTYQGLRGNSFAEDFMPISEKDSEFATKWSNLATAHMNEGIRDPIKVYEYLNRFYVVEGNKRVSVLKFFGAYSVLAKVTRLIPKRDPKDKLNTLYYEFMNFNHKTGIFSIWMSKIGNFDKLLEYINNFTPPQGKFEVDNKYKYIENYVYFNFRKIYKEVNGGDIPITTGDAFLEYVKLYGIPTEIDQQELKIFLKKFILEVEALSKHKAIDVQTSPETPSPSNGVLSTFTSLIKPKKKLKIAFLYNNFISKSDWIYSHECGRQHIDKIFKDSIETSYYENIPENDDALPIINSLVNDGVDLIFTTSPGFITVSLKAALEYPSVRFFNCSATHFLKHLSTYWGRLHEPKFLAGMIAGSMTKTNKVGYIASHPIPDIISSLNAFALGVQSVNPKAEIQVNWTSEWGYGKKSKDAINYFIDNNFDIISSNFNMVPNSLPKNFGISSSTCLVKEDKSLQYLTSPVWYWGLFYENIIKNILNGTWKNLMDIFSSNSKIINFWWGISSGVVDIDMDAFLIPNQTKKMVKFMREMIINDTFTPFLGPVYDRDKHLKIKDGECPTIDEILTMDWIVEGVTGDMPIIDI